MPFFGSSIFNDPWMNDPLDDFGFSILTPNRRRAARQQHQHLQKYAPINEMDRAIVDFNELLRDPVSMSVQENANEYELTVRHPGLNKENLQIDLNERVLTISGKRTEESTNKIPTGNSNTSNAQQQKNAATAAAVAGQGQKPEQKDVNAPGTSTSAVNIKDQQGNSEFYSYSSRSFQRTMTLPEDVDVSKIKAKHDGGVLKLLLPKIVSAQNKRQQIMIE